MDDNERSSLALSNSVQKGIEKDLRRFFEPVPGLTDHKEYLEFLSDAYNSIKKYHIDIAVEKAPISEELLENAKRILLNSLSLTENHGYWITQRACWGNKHDGPVEDIVLSQVPLSDRQFIFVTNLNENPDVLEDVKSLREAVIRYAHEAKVGSKPIMSDALFNFVMTGLPKRSFRNLSDLL